VWRGGQRAGAGHERIRADTPPHAPGSGVGGRSLFSIQHSAFSIRRSSVVGRRDGAPGRERLAGGAQQVPVRVIRIRLSVDRASLMWPGACPEKRYKHG
jgi:hypothetical protein